MLSSIKSKIIVLTVSLLCALSVTITGAVLFAFYHNKELMINGSGYAISSLAGNVNREIAALENNAMDLALIGEVYYQAGKQDSIGKYLVSRIFQNYPNSLGGGIWFKPYALSPDKKRSCIYAFNQNGKIILDTAFESERYNYLGQSWYQDIMPHLEAGKKLFWSKPYYENQGAKTLMTTVGSGIYHDGRLIGLSTVDWQMDALLNSVLKIKPTPNSLVLFADTANDYIIAATDSKKSDTSFMGKSLKNLGWYSPDLSESKLFEYKGKKYIPYIKQLGNDLILIISVPITEMFRDVRQHLFILSGMLILSMLLIVSALYAALKRNINKPISKLTSMAKEIGNGNLNLTIRLDKPDELANLASVLNQMTADIKSQIIHLAKVSSEKEKIESELNIAHTIQTSALPHEFPKNECFDLIASMTAAREVGGDFYDFFPIDDNRYVFVIADVSGKGITAALYMMSAKAIIKNTLQSGHALTEAADKVNKGLCDNHARGMFVTAFIGVLDLNTGRVDYINAGHCPPLHKTQKGYDYVPVVRNLVLGITPNYKYEKGSFLLKPKERLFLYTDGVTEAKTKAEKLFGPDRLKKALNQKDCSLPDTLVHIRKKITQFVCGADQSDDITMMMIEFHHKKK